LGKSYADGNELSDSIKENVFLVTGMADGFMKMTLLCEVDS
jgi:hypothetical protein